MGPPLLLGPRQASLPKLSSLSVGCICLLCSLLPTKGAVESTGREPPRRPSAPCPRAGVLTHRVVGSGAGCALQDLVDLKGDDSRAVSTSFPLPSTVRHPHHCLAGAGDAQARLQRGLSQARTWLRARTSTPLRLEDFEETRDVTPLHTHPPPLRPTLRKTNE